MNYGGGVALQRKRQGETSAKQRGVRESVAHPRISQRRRLARAECMNRIAMAGISAADEGKKINGCTVL